MTTGESRHFFPLTTLQIGDLQSYLSRLTIFLARESNNLYILVDNRPWLINQDKHSAYLWQLMVTKSRLSPFANNRARRELKIAEKGPDSTYSSKMERKIKGRVLFGSDVTLRKKEILSKWFTMVDDALSQEKALLPMKKLKNTFALRNELHQTLYGFIVFKITWNHVRGINYLNELQTDTSMALEAKLMKRWEFDSIDQAARSIYSWFSGTSHENFLLRQHLESLSAPGDMFYDAQEDIPGAKSDVTCIFSNTFSVIPCSVDGEVTSPHTQPPSGPYKRRKIVISPSSLDVADELSAKSFSEITSAEARNPSSSMDSLEKDSGASFLVEATTYKDVLVLFRFNDHDLPFMLKDIIVSDLRLLTLLEYGLPSWVIFLQSYPLFCQIYRPWMCPLARVLYVLISVITVVIGFYDLYKNVPLLKSTAARLLGPFFDWIESWEMVSRIKYLGTMLFLHNFEKALKWFVMATHAFRSLLSILIRPIAEPVGELFELVLPFWNACVETAESMGSVLWILLCSSWSVIVGIQKFIIWPFRFVVSILWEIVTFILHPIIWLLWELLKSPFSLIIAIARLIMMFFSCFYEFFLESWLFVSSMFQFSSTTEVVTSSNLQVSGWRSLWNDLFSQVFRAVRSILYGFVAFFSTCNRHRLSIYNHIRKFLARLSREDHRKIRKDSAHFHHKPRDRNLMEEKVQCNFGFSPTQEKQSRSRKKKASKLD